MQLSIPGVGDLEVKHLVLDFNGTIARDGQLLSNLDQTLQKLAEKITIHILTADTGGTVRHELAGLPCTLHIITAGSEAEQKAAYIRQLGADQTICFGNGANDCLMLQEARLGVAVLEGEGTAVSAVNHADIVCRSIYDAMGLLMVPQRIIATMRR